MGNIKRYSKSIWAFIGNTIDNIANHIWFIAVQYLMFFLFFIASVFALYFLNSLFVYDFNFTSLKASDNFEFFIIFCFVMAIPFHTYFILNNSEWFSSLKPESKKAKQERYDDFKAVTWKKLCIVYENDFEERLRLYKHIIEYDLANLKDEEYNELIKEIDKLIKDFDNQENPDMPKSEISKYMREIEFNNAVNRRASYRH